MRDVFDNGLKLLSEPMPHVRSVSLGAWLTRGSRHEGDADAGIAHFTEHMLFKGTASRSAEEIAQEVDSMGGHLDAFTAKEYAAYYIKVLDEHLPRAVDLLADLLLRPAFRAEDVRREAHVILEEIKMVEDTPDDLVHELFSRSFWPEHPLGRSILGSPASVGAITSDGLRSFFERSYISGNLVITAAGNVEHARLRDLIGSAFDALPASAAAPSDASPTAAAGLWQRTKPVEQTHVCLGVPAHPQTHEARYPCYVLNTVLGGSMSSRLFQNIREKRGLAYAVSSGLEAYRDTGMLLVYVGCAAEAVREVIDLVAVELRRLAQEPIPAGELQRARDHLKGQSGARARKYGQPHVGVGALGDLLRTAVRLDGGSRAHRRDLGRRCAAGGGGSVLERQHLAATVLGPGDGQAPTADQLAL